MKRNTIRIVCLLMTVAMLLCMLPATAMATESNTITITMTDSYGDGWNGNMLHMFIDGNFYSNLDLESGSEDTWSMEFTDSVFSFYWGKGEYAEECSFTISINGEDVHSVDDCSELADDQFIYTNCTHPDSYEETVDACCTLEGGTYKRCIKCHDIMDTLEIVPPTGHTFVDGVCSVCGDKPILAIEMKDSYGDGWNDAAVEIYIDGENTETVTLTGESATVSIDYDENKLYVLKWVKGEYDSECQVRIFVNGLEEIGIYDFTDIADGEIIYSNCTHTYGDGEVVAPTCAEVGYTLYTCTTCGFWKKADFTDPLGHDFADNGICNDCGVSKSITIEMADSSLDGWSGNAIEVYEDHILLATVTIEDGSEGLWSTPYDDTKLYTFKWIEGSMANECIFNILINGKVEFSVEQEYAQDLRDGQVFFSNCVHNFEEVVTPPTCFSQGYTTYTCSICGCVNVTDHTEALDHVPQEGTELVYEPTCTEGGYTYYHCSLCGTGFVADFTDPAHDFDENGNCTRCGIANSVLLYFKNTDGWENVYAHAYDSEQNPYGDTSYILTYVEADIYAVELPNGTSYVEFYSDAGSQTDILLIPDDGNNLYYGFGWDKYQSITMKYPNLTLDGEVKIGVHFTITDNDIDPMDLGLAVFDSYMPEGTVDDAVYVSDGASCDESEFAVFTRGIPAKNLGDTIYFRVFYQLDSGVYIYSDMKSYSGKLYAQNSLNGNGEADAKALAVALMNYGAQAQLFFNYKTDELMNSFLTDEQKALAPAYREDMITGVSPIPQDLQGSFYPRSGFDTMYANSSLEGEIGLNYYFTITEPYITILDAYYWYANTLQEGEVFTKENAEERVFINQNSEGVFYFTQSLPASMINQPLYVAVTYTDNDYVEYSTGVLPYSFGMYLKNTIAGGDDDLVALAKVTAVYGYLAQEYFMPAEA